MQHASVDRIGRPNDIARLVDVLSDARLSPSGAKVGDHTLIKSEGV